MPPARRFSIVGWLGRATRVKNPYKVEVIWMLIIILGPAVLGLMLAFLAPAALYTLDSHPPEQEAIRAGAASVAVKMAHEHGDRQK